MLSSLWDHYGPVDYEEDYYYYDDEVKQN